MTRFLLLGSTADSDYWTKIIILLSPTVWFFYTSHARVCVAYSMARRRQRHREDIWYRANLPARLRSLCVSTPLRMSHKYHCLHTNTPLFVVLIQPQHLHNLRLHPRHGVRPPPPPHPSHHRRIVHISNLHLLCVAKLEPSGEITWRGQEKARALSAPLFFRLPKPHIIVVTRQRFFSPDL